MLIPKHWAEARLQHKEPGKQVTVKRWGWSDVSQEDAQNRANQRAEEALARAWAGEDLRRRELLDTYGTEEGVPIREEVVARHGDTVVTRNSYGALCLNTPDVFFADVDTGWKEGTTVYAAGCLCVIVAGVGVGVWAKSWGLGVLALFAGVWLLTAAINQHNRMRRAGEERRNREAALKTIRKFSASHPDWHLRVYETPAGYRLLAMHDVFDPKGEAARRAMEEMNSDRRFVTLCRLQSCFRARVSPKPWRVGYRPEVSLPKAKYPFPPEVVATRTRWIAGYERAAGGHASCRFLEKLGSERVHPRAEKIRGLHDDYCRALTPLPLA